MGNCNNSRHCNSVRHTCGSTMKAACVDYETELPEFSGISDCADIEQTTTELYELVGDIREQIDLSELGEQCLDYVLDEDDKIVVKNVLLAYETEICALKERVETLENTAFCDMSLEACGLDFECLTDACSGEITTVKELLQALITKSCEV